MNVVQFIWHDQQYIGNISPNRRIRLFNKPYSFLDVVKMALKKEQTLSQYIAENLSNVYLDIVDIASPSFTFKAISHRHPMSTWVGGTGLTHKNRAVIRKHMENLDAKNESLSDSEKIYMAGVHDGKKQLSQEGARPEWFFKGHAEQIVTSGEPLPIPSHDIGGGEEAELVGVYYVDENKHIHRLGFCLGNEFSDHTLERENHFYISQCKLRAFALSSEIMIGELPTNVQLTSCIYRDEQLLWQAQIATGQDNMIHSYGNIESHVFRHAQFLTPDTLYYHFMGTSHISYVDGVCMQNNDIVKIESDYFMFPLINQIKKHQQSHVVHISHMR